MPIEVPYQIANLTREEFLERDEVVLRCAYASQNHLGRFCDERVYENDVAARLRAEGMSNTQTQVPVTVTHGLFCKVYRLDLCADGAVYEFKTVNQFSGEHDAQVFTYAMLLDVRYIKLLNFRNPKVQGRLRLVPFSRAERFACRVDHSLWEPISPKCFELRTQLSEILADWGGFLEAPLYEAALGCVITAPQTRLPVIRDGIELGSHHLRMMSDGLAFCVTGFTQSLDFQRSHLERLLRSLPLRALHWINFNHSVVSLVTLRQHGV